MNFLDPTTKQWTPSHETIDLLPPGGAFAAAATHGQHSARFPLDIATGVIQLSGPGGEQLTSRPVALFFEDDNNSVLIAILTNSVGELVGSNEVVYPDTFEGAAASIRYTYTKAGFEQDIVVQGHLPDPAALGLVPARTKLGVLTTFFDTNNPVATPGPVDAADGLSDSTLSFGSARMGQGRAFSIGDTEPSAPPATVTPSPWLNWITNTAQQSSFSKGTPTYKRWFQLQGRSFLMEEVPYRRVAAQLEQLPPATGRLNTVSTNLLAADSFLDAIPARLLSLPASGEPVKTQTMRLSRVDWDQTPALVLDYYVTVPGMPGDYSFQSGTTYYVSGMCDLANVTIAGGAVIKYANVNSCTPIQLGAWEYGTAFIVVEGTLTCQTSSDNPAVFTAADDDNVGYPLPEPLSMHDPTGNYYANPAIYAPSQASFNLSNVRIRYAAQAVYKGGAYYGTTITLSDLQVIDSGVMAVLGCGYGYDGPMTLTCNNCLYSGPSYVAILDCGNVSDNYNLTNCTIDNAYHLVYGNATSSTGNAVNCIFADTYLGDCSWQGSYNGFYNCQTFGSNPITDQDYPFQTSANDNYYLAVNPDGSDASGFRNVGTTAIDQNLWAELRTMTTYAPQDGGWPDGDRPDLGYHYYTTVSLNQDSNHDNLPDWWEISWFGNLNHPGSEQDNSGNTLLYDYQHNIDPTKPEGLTTAQKQLYGANTNAALGFGVWLAEPLLFGIP